MDGELLSRLDNGGSLYKQFSGFLMLSHVNLMCSAQEKMANLEGVGCCFAGGALRCLNTGLRVSEHPLVFRTVIPLTVTRTQVRESHHAWGASFSEEVLSALFGSSPEASLHLGTCDALQTAQILAMPRRIFHPA